MRSDAAVKMMGEVPQRADSEDAWRQAQNRILQLEHSTQRMSSRWFLGNAGVIAAAALFLITAIFLMLWVARMLDYSAKAEHAQSVLHEVSEVQNAISESAALTRAYVLSRDSTLLRDGVRANKTVWAHMVALDSLLATNTEGRALMAENRRDLARRIALYNVLIAAPTATITITSEKELLRLAHLNNVQFSLLRDRATGDFKRYQKGITDDMRLAMVLALFSGIASPLFGLIGIHLLRRERQSQQTRQLQLELIHVQRLAVMGQTSAMLAHEINQPLSAANNYISVARRLLENQEAGKAIAVLERVAQQIQRAAAIVLKLRRFIEKRESEHSLEAPNVLVDDAIMLLGTLDGSIALTTQIAPDLPRVFVDRVQVQQVLVNLMRNAIEAMQGSARRELSLSITYAGGETVQVALTDSGPGLAPEVMERLFQPFVSTKSGGMGIGLSICKSIISQHGGRIWVEPNPQGGTVFRFTLPVVAVRAAA